MLVVLQVVCGSELISGVGSLCPSVVVKVS